jgi:hypothetical protein
MKPIIACLICTVAVACIGFAPSKADAGWYGRGVGISIGIGPRYGYYGYRRPYGYYGYRYRPYGYYGYRYRPYGYYGYRRYGYDGYRPYRGYWAGRAYRRWR